MHKSDKILRILTVMVGVFVFGYFLTTNIGPRDLKNNFTDRSHGEVEKKLVQKNQDTTQLQNLPEKIPKKEVSIIDRAGIEISPSIETNLPPSEVFRLAGSRDSNIDYWKQVLVEEDRNESKYIVIPSNGLVVPINEFGEDSQEFDKMINGREVDINTALETGALEYPGTSINGYGEEGNKMVFAHSSFWKGEEGRYKTHFQKIIELDPGEEVWIYEKNSLGGYTQYRYVTEESYNTSEYDTSIFVPGAGKILTLFTCTPIGGTEGRWIIRAKHVDTFGAQKG